MSSNHFLPAWILLFGALLCAQPTPPSPAAQPPQSAPTPSQHAGSTSNSAEGLIKLDVLVTDASGKPVTGLAPQDFTLLEKSQPRQILSFHAFDGVLAKPDPPSEVILLIDVLNIPGHLANHAKEEIEKYLRQNGGHLAQPASVFLLDNTGIQLTAGPSIDGNLVAAELAWSPDSRLPRPAPAAPVQRLPEVRDAISGMHLPAEKTLTALGMIASIERRKLGKKLLIWVGPGSGIGSGMHSDTAKDQDQLFNLIVWFSTLLRESRIALYNTSVGKVDPQQHLDADFLKAAESPKDASVKKLYRDVLAVESGGSVSEPGDDLAAQIDHCVREASAFYALSFDPSHADHLDEFHDLHVQVSQPGLTARTSTGYYDQPYYSYQTDPRTKPVTVAELDQWLQANRDKNDGELARELSDLELTERLSAPKLSSWTERLHGEKARRALAGLADMSVFLTLPAAEISADAPPSAPEQQRIIAAAADYLSNSIPLLPNFFARRTAARYLEALKLDPEHRRIEFQPLRLTESATATVLYRRDREVLDSEAEKGRKQKPGDPDFSTYGTFGPVLSVIGDVLAAPEELTWSRWEQVADRPSAVLSFRVPAGKSRYLVGGCCLPDGDGTSGFAKLAPFHGEIAIDPATGAILRLDVVSDLKEFTPLLLSDIMVTYGPVQIGGKTYICPVRSVSIMRFRSVNNSTAWNESFRTYGPWVTMVDEYTFDDFHMFRSESRVLAPPPSPPEKN